MAEVLQEDIEAIIKEVLRKIDMPMPDAAQSACDPGSDWGVFNSLDDAVAAATVACKQLATIATREKVVQVVLFR